MCMHIYIYIYIAYIYIYIYIYYTIHKCRGLYTQTQISKSLGWRAQEVKSRWRLFGRQGLCPELFPATELLGFTLGASGFRGFESLVLGLGFRGLGLGFRG